MACGFCKLGLNSLTPEGRCPIGNSKKNKIKLVHKDILSSGVPQIWKSLFKGKDEITWSPGRDLSFPQAFL